MDKERLTKIMELEGKVALITGASRGIGRSIALEMAKEGAKIAFVYNNSHSSAQSLYNQITSLGGKCLICKGDVASDEDRNRILSQITKEYGRLDILVNNAAIYSKKGFFDANQADLERIFAVNFFAPFLLSQEIGRRMVEQKSGSIINIASNAVEHGKKDKGIDYVSTKAALLSLTHSLAVTLAPYARINAISPGYTDTEMARFWQNDELKAEIEKTIPLGRVNLPIDIAHAAVFLASDKARNITGQNLIIDGGRSLA